MHHRGIRLPVVGALVLVWMAGMLLITHQAEPAAPVAAQDTSTIPGETWYNQQCAVCHGVRGTGELGPPLNVPPPPNVRNLPEEEQAAMFRNLVRNGIPGKMPGYLPSQVSDDQADQIRAYLKTLQDIPPGDSIYDAMIEVTPEQPAGREFFMQLFERARFELHEDRPEGEQVLLSLLERESFDLHNHSNCSVLSMTSGRDLLLVGSSNNLPPVLAVVARPS